MSRPIQAFAKRLSEFSNGSCTAVPSIAETHEFTDSLIRTLFPIMENRPSDPDGIVLELERCTNQLKDLLRSINKSLLQSPEELATLFFQRLPGVFEQLASRCRVHYPFRPGRQLC